MIPDPTHIDTFVEEHLLTYATTCFADNDVYPMDTAEKDATAFAERLDPIHRKSFATLRELLDESLLPAWSTFSPSYRFGLDLKRPHHAFSISGPLRFLEQERDWSDDAYAIGTDGSGMLSVLLTDGRVAQMWREDSHVLSDAYVDLNQFLFASICVAITPSVIAYDACIKILAPIEAAEYHIDALEEEMGFELD